MAKQGYPPTDIVLIVAIRLCSNSLVKIAKVLGTNVVEILNSEFVREGYVTAPMPAFPQLPFVPLGNLIESPRVTLRRHPFSFPI